MPTGPSTGTVITPITTTTVPQQYNKVLSDNNVVVVNNPGNRNDYWKGYDNKPSKYARTNSVKSPITTAKPNRPELSQLNTQAKAPRASTSQVPRSTGAKPDWKGQSGYAGANPEARAKAKLPPPSKTAAAKTANNAATARAKVGEQSGGRNPAAGASNVDRGRSSTPKPAARPAEPAETGLPAEFAEAGIQARQRVEAGVHALTPEPCRPSSAPKRPTAVSGSHKGGADRAASQRGKQSMPQGARSKGGGGNQKRR